MNARQTIEKLLEGTTITINGPHPWDPQVHDERAYRRVLSGGSLALGESYMDGSWDAEDVAEMIHRIVRGGIIEHAPTPLSLTLHVLAARVFNMQSFSRSPIVAKRHYDVGINLFTKMLGPTMAYSCGYWKTARTLDEAQTAKFDLICRKLFLQKGQRILDIGCGFGTFAEYAVKQYGVSVVGATLSEVQATYAKERLAGLPVQILVADYRRLEGTFDHIVSVGMFEHVGYKNYRTYMMKVHSLLKKGGLFLLHTIGNSVSRKAGEPWLNKYIFPNGMLPSLAQIGRSIEGLFVLEDIHNFGADYDTTLMSWFANFDAAWPELKEKYGLPAEASAQAGERFYRMWKFYLLSSAGLFRSRSTQLWQIVLSKEGVPGGYAPVR